MSDELITGTFSSGSTGQRIEAVDIVPNPDLDPPDVKTFRLILDVLRANELHQGACAHLQTEKAQRRTDAYLTPQDCTCWLAEG